MLIGRQAPRYEELAHLYPESKSLQNSLLEYFIVVVRLYHYVLKSSQKTKFGHFISSLGDSEFERFRSDLETRGSSIKDEVATLTMSLIKAEASRGGRFRARCLGESQIAILKREAKLKAKILKLCTEFEYEYSWKQLRKAGTAQLFLHQSEYQEWKSSPSSSTLIWTGKMGSGKSVLLANIVDDLNLNPSCQKSLVTYFFCQWDVVESLQARTILGSLANQVLKTFYNGCSNDPIWQDIALKDTRADLEALTTMIIKVMPKNWHLDFVLDGVDDCADDEAIQLYRQLNILQSSIGMNICTSTGIENQSSPKSQLSKNLICLQILNIPEQNLDIANFIDIELARCVQSGDLVISDGALILDIRDALLQGAQGMMLWVALQIGAICAEKTDDHVRQALKELPRPLSEVFARELQRSYSKSTIEYRDRAVILLLGSVRPLNLEEFREAISVEPGNYDWQPAKHVNDVRSALTGLGKLVLVDEESSMVRISHHSIKKYLLSAYVHADGQGFDDFFVHLNMTEIVRTYLSYGVFDRQLSTRVVPHISTRRIAPTILATTIKSEKAADLALRLLQLGRTTDFDLGKAMAKITNAAEITIAETFPFRQYAERHFLDHAWTYILSKEHWRLSASLVIIRRWNPKIWQTVEWQIEGTNTVDRSVALKFRWSTQEGTALLLALSTPNAPRLSDLWYMIDLEGISCLEWATTKADPKLLCNLTSRYVETEPMNKIYGLRNALYYALRKSNFTAAKYLLDEYLGHGLSAYRILIVLVYSNDLQAVEWLFNYGMSPNIVYNHLPADGGTGKLPWDKILDPVYKEGKYPLLFFAVLSESAKMVYLCLKRGSLVSSLRIRYKDTDLNRIFPFLVRNEFLTIYKQLLFVNSYFLHDVPWYGKFVGRKAKVLERIESDLKGCLSYRRGDVIDIIMPSYTQYWLGATGQVVGSFLAGNVEPITEVRAIHDFTGIERDELSFKSGDIIVVEETIHEGWWRGSLNDEIGLFPVNYVERITLCIETGGPDMEDWESGRWSLTSLTLCFTKFY